MDIGLMFDEAKSLYIYHPECDKIPGSNLSYKDDNKTIKTMSKLDVIACYDQGVFTNSDLHIANIVAKNVFATQGMVEKYIEHISTTKGEKEKVPMIQSMNHLKSRLKDLARANILMKYSFNAPAHDGEGYYKQSYYLVSPHGYNFLKKVVGFNDNYDEYLAATPVDEVFKYLTTVTVCQGFLQQAGLKDYKINVPYYSKKSKQLHQIFGIVNTKKEDVDYKLIIEPIKFRFDKNRISEKDWVYSIHRRFLLLKEYIEYLASKGEFNYGILVACEDIKGIKQAALFVQKYLEEYQSYVYFTTDAVVNYRGIRNSFVCLTKDGDLLHTVPTFID